MAEKQLPLIPSSFTKTTHIRQSRPVKATYICSPAVKGNESISTLYTTLPHDKLKTRLKETIHKAFSHRNYGSKFVVLSYNSTYFSNKIQ